ncbi:monooxygenase, partial [Mycobacterium sp. ITM-2017-0098]
TPIDVRGDAITIADQMGLLTEVRAHRIRMSERTQFVDSSGTPVAPFPWAEVSDSDDDIEVLRGDLLRILAEALPDTVATRFGDSPVSLTDGAAG